MEAEYDDNVLDYWRLPDGNYIVKMRKDDGLDCDNDVKITIPCHLGAFLLSKIKRIMNNLNRDFDGFYRMNINYTETDSLYKERKYWDVLDEAGLVGSNFNRGRNDYKNGSIFLFVFSCQKILFNC